MAADGRFMILRTPVLGMIGDETQVFTEDDNFSTFGRFHWMIAVSNDGSDELAAGYLRFQSVRFSIWLAGLF